MRMDGIIVTLNKLNPTNSGNPKHSFAFKSNPDGTLTQIVNVNYNTTKDGKLNRFESLNQSIYRVLL